MFMNRFVLYEELLSVLNKLLQVFLQCIDLRMHIVHSKIQKKRGGVEDSQNRRMWFSVGRMIAGRRLECHGAPFLF